VRNLGKIKAKFRQKQWRSKGASGARAWGAGLRGASAHFLQSFKNAFKAEI